MTDTQTQAEFFNKIGAEETAGAQRAMDRFPPPVAATGSRRMDLWRLRRLHRLAGIAMQKCRAH
jgi:hypothetical protein